MITHPRTDARQPGYRIPTAEYKTLITAYRLIAMEIKQ